MHEPTYKVTSYQVKSYEYFGQSLEIPEDAEATDLASRMVERAWSRIRDEIDRTALLLIERGERRQAAERATREFERYLASNEYRIDWQNEPWVMGRYLSRFG